MTTRPVLMTYANIQDRIEQILQDSGAATYTTTMTNMWIEDGLKEFSPYDSHIVPVVFKIESRTGTDDTGLANSVSDTAKSQFVAGDATYEKVVHNTTDDTWAIVLANTDTTANTLSADIMDSDENYAIYNKRCWNNKQIYLGDMPPYLWVDSVEYPIGTKRNWKVYNDVLEIDVDSVDDSDSTLDTLGKTNVLVRFAKTHKLCQMTDLLGAVHTTRDLTTLPVNAVIAYNFNLTETCEMGDEFHIANHRSLYTCTEAITWSDNTNGNVLYFYPELEATATALDTITFIGSTLKPQHEELFCHLVAARGLISEANAQLIQAKADLTTGRALVNTINKGGPGATVANAYIAYARAGEELAREQRSMGERKLAEVIGKMEVLSPPRTKRSYPSD